MIGKEDDDVDNTIRSRSRRWAVTQITVVVDCDVMYFERAYRVDEGWRARAGSAVGQRLTLYSATTGDEDEELVERVLNRRRSTRR